MTLTKAYAIDLDFLVPMSIWELESLDSNVLTEEVPLCLHASLLMFYYISSFSCILKYDVLKTRFKRFYSCFYYVSLYSNFKEVDLMLSCPSLVLTFKDYFWRIDIDL